MIVEYNEVYRNEWDMFVLDRSVNGNFLQTRNFLDYHPKERFKDSSILFFYKNRIAAVIPANIIGNTILSHEGSTYGGLVIGKEFANSRNYDWIFDEMIAYFRHKGFKKVELRTHNWLYSPVDKHNELLDYYFQQYGFGIRSEVGFYIDLRALVENFTDHFEMLKKRKLNKAYKAGLSFKKLLHDDDVKMFYMVLAENMRKFDTIPVHTEEELLDFKNNRLNEETSFYGVYYKEKMIAGSMVWNFCNKKVFHTQYLASLSDYLSYCPNEYLYENLIRVAHDEGFRYLSFGTACIDHGRIYNKSLGQYKEGFNTDSYLNTCYIWVNYDEQKI